MGIMKTPVTAAPSVAHDEATLRFYTDEAQVYSARGRDGPSQRLNLLLDRLKPGARVLELGCGDGRDSEAMLARGFDVHPTDGSEAMARQAEVRLGHPVCTMRFDELAAREAYDGIWANASLLHAPRSALLDILARIFAALKPGGIHVATFKAGSAEGRDGLGRYFNYLSAAEAQAAYRGSADWEILSIQSYTGGDYEGGRRPWIAVTARRPA
jgi:SAM-dependent methyltransferase